MNTLRFNQLGAAATLNAATFFDRVNLDDVHAACMTAAHVVLFQYGVDEWVLVDFDVPWKHARIAEDECKLGLDGDFSIFDVEEPSLVAMLPDLASRRYRLGEVAGHAVFEPAPVDDFKIDITCHGPSDSSSVYGTAWGADDDQLDEDYDGFDESFVDHFWCLPGAVAEAIITTWNSYFDDDAGFVDRLADLDVWFFPDGTPVDLQHIDLTPPILEVSAHQLTLETAS